MTDIITKTIAKVAAFQQMHGANPIRVFINDHMYNTFTNIAGAIFNSVKDQYLLNKCQEEIRFKAQVKESKTYIVLEEIFQLQIPKNIKDSVVLDFLELGKKLKSDLLMSIYIDRFEKGELTLENIHRRIKFSKYIGYDSKIFAFICQKINSIDTDDLRDSVIVAGFDFAERLMTHFKYCNISSNDLIFSIVNKHHSFIDILSNLNAKYIEIEDIYESLKTFSIIDDKDLKKNIQSLIITKFKTFQDGIEDKEQEIKELKDKITTLQEKYTTTFNDLTNLKVENMQLKEDNSKQSDEITKLRRRNNHLCIEKKSIGDELANMRIEKKQLLKDCSILKEKIEKLKIEKEQLKNINSSQSDEITKLKRENIQLSLEKKSIDDELANMRAETTQLKNFNSNHKEKIEKLKKEKEQLKNDNTCQCNEITKLRRENTQISLENANIKDKLIRREKDNIKIQKKGKKLQKFNRIKQN